MSSLIASLATNGYVVILTTLTSIISLILALVFYLRSKREKKPRLLIKSINLFNKDAQKINGLSTTYYDRPVLNMTITRVALWNSGHDPILRSDISPTDPITIYINPKYRILESQILCTKKAQNGIKLGLIENGLKTRINFEYLDYGGGAVIQVVHTGNSSSDIIVEGTIRGFGKLRTTRVKANHGLPVGGPAFLRRYRKLGIAMFYVYSFLIAMIVVINPAIISNGLYPFIVKIISCLAINLLLFIAYFSRGRKRVPKQFGTFQEGFS